MTRRERPTHHRKQPVDENLILRIEVAMLRAGLNQSQLAAQIGCTPGLVTHWMHRRNAPGVDMLRKLAPVLRVSVGYLMGDEVVTDAERLAERAMLEHIKHGGERLAKLFCQFQPDELSSVLEDALAKRSDSGQSRPPKTPRR